MKFLKLNLKRIVIFGGLVVVFLLAGVLVYRGLTKGPVRKAVAEPKVSASTTSQKMGLPVQLKIAKIGVDAPVELMGLLPNGDMQAPAGPHTVGWYKYGTHPGDIGSAVIAGHFGPWQDGEHSVFDNLSKLKKGDVVSITNDRGAVANFVVQALRDYAPEADSKSVFLSSDGRAHVNLITCDGSWNDATKSYNKRLVVFTDKQ